MVNSGSSANLLALAAITNPARSVRLHPGDRVGIPAVCWSTSLWPIIQMGLVPVLLDVDPDTLNLSIPSLEHALSIQPLQAVMAVHVLGNSTDLDQLLAIVDRHDLILIEDACEALGSTHRSNWLGTLGSFGTYSFYFSHHMTTIEGGMIVARSEEDEDLLRCLRSHGWSREQSNRLAHEQASPDIDPRFLFINLGYNVRPMELQAAFGAEQLQRLPTMNANRRHNISLGQQAFHAHPSWRGQLHFPAPTPGLDPCWFAFPFLVDRDISFDRAAFTRDLLARGIDTRPIISGNMALQPALDMFRVDRSLEPFRGAQQVHDRGFFVGAHARPIGNARLDHLVDAVLSALEASHL